AGRGYRNEELQRKFFDGLEPKWLEKMMDIAEIEKLKTNFETKMTKQFKKTPPTIPPKDYKEIYEHYISQGDPKPGLNNKELLREVIKFFDLPSV
ncbi:4869_t:CDS:2, partial [Diversispora eburnea]